MDYTKQPLDYSQQIALLKSRGLIISDEAEAQRILSNLGYFRLANYLRPMESDKQSHIFKSHSTFENAYSLYAFDRDLRDIVFKALSRIEIALRAKIIHFFSLTHGSFWFLDMSLSCDEHLFLDNLNSIDRELRRTKEEFVKEHFKKYDKPSFPPAWKTLELASFGALSKMYLNFNDNKAKKSIARAFGLPQHVILESWIASLTHLRNCCAHHARIWNRNFPITPTVPKTLKSHWIAQTQFPTNKLYAQLCCIAYLLNAIYPDNSFAQDLRSLIDAHNNVDVSSMGFPDGWEKEPLWR